MPETQWEWSDLPQARQPWVWNQDSAHWLPDSGAHTQLLPYFSTDTDTVMVSEYNPFVIGGIHYVLHWA